MKNKWKNIWRGDGIVNFRGKRRWLFGGMQREKWKMGMERYGGWDSGPALWRCTLS